MTEYLECVLILSLSALSASVDSREITRVIFFSFSGDSRTEVSIDIVEELSDSPRLPTEPPLVNVARLLEHGTPYVKNVIQQTCYTLFQ